jgi:hypothetical protein
LWLSIVSERPVLKPSSARYARAGQGMGNFESFNV